MKVAVAGEFGHLESDIVRSAVYIKQCYKK